MYIRIIKAIIQRLKYDSLKLAKKQNKSKFVANWYFFDMMLCFLLFGTDANDYIQCDLYKKNIFKRFREYKQWDATGVKKRLYRREQNKIRRMLSKYSSIKYEYPTIRRVIRHRKYEKTFNMGDNCGLQYGVWIWREHNSREKIIIGNNVLLTRNVDLDYTGGLEIGNGVAISEGVKILTHGHDFLGLKDESEIIPDTNRVYFSKLTIEDNVLIGAHAIIMPEVNTIGENSIISTGSIVTKRVPPNVVVAGNPAKIVFDFPAEIRHKTQSK